MMNHTVERLDIDVDAHFAKYRELVEKRRALKSRMERAESEKRSVNERVFQKVFKEYSRELQTIESELEPVARSLQNARATMQDQIKDIDLQVEEIQERIEEIAFRNRVGEFDTAASDELRAPLADECERLSRRRHQLSESLSRMDTREAAGQQPRSEPPARTAAREEMKQPPKTESVSRADKRETAVERPRTERREVPGPAQATKTVNQLKSHVSLEEASGEKETFVDPTEWVGEFVQDENPEPAESEFEGDPLFSESGKVKDETSASSSENEEPEDPLAGLADPSDESTEEASAAEPQVNRRAPQQAAYGGLPILTITQGPGAGKKLPLLPMTMTLGREVDNNIELKDVDVARYHARISFEAGQYVIQDLEGSSGTFVNGQRISKTPLSPGSSIRVGGTELHFDLG